MTTEPLRDQRLLSAVDLINLGGIRLLSIDIFDTLLIRRVPKPSDVFLQLGVVLQGRGLLSAGQTPDSFAAIRYQTEYAAREAQQRQHGNREVTLSEIYAKAPAHVVRTSVEELVAAEVAVENQLCFPNPDVILLARIAQQKGVRLSLISNSYFSEQVIRALVRSKAMGLPEADGFFISSENRCGKSDGLMQRMLDAFNLKPAECLHIGDDPVSDRATAAALGIPCVYIGYGEEAFSTSLAEEHPLQWHDRADYFADVNGDYGLTWLRRQMGHRPLLDLKDTEKTYYVYAVQMLAPLVAGFAAWVGARLKAEGGERIYGIAREGELLSELVSILDHQAERRVLSTSRLAATLASFAPDYPDYLEDFLTRRGHWTIGALMEQLGFGPEQAAFIGNPEATLDIVSPHELTQRLLASPLAHQLFERSAARRKRLLLHLKAIGALEKERLFLLDLGYAATIQRALQRIFIIENIPVTTHGLYLASAHVSLATQAAGGIVEGFLAQNGNPNDFSRAFCRSPEIVELSCMPPHGTVLDYEEDGTPVRAEDVTPLRQQKEVAIVQQGIRDFTLSFCALIKTAPVVADFGRPSWQAQMRSIATRMVVYPSLAEAQLLGHWQSDSDLGLASPRPIVSAAYANKNFSITAAQLMAMPRRDIPWLYGVAACIGHSLARQIASLMLRKEAPDAFISPVEPEQKDGLFLDPFKALPEVSSIEASRLQDLCQTALNDYAAKGSFDRAAWMRLLMQPSLSERQFVYTYLAQRFEERRETKYAYGLIEKAWRIGKRDRENFDRLWSIADKRKPDHHLWRFLREASLAAAATHDANYMLEVICQAHSAAYRAYAERVPYTPFQDCVSLGVAVKACRDIRPQLPPLDSLANRPLRLGYVLSGELGETYTPITDISFSLAMAHDPHQVDACVISVCTEDEVMSSARLSASVKKLRDAGQKIVFQPKPEQSGVANALRQLVANLALQNFDALIFTTLSGRQLALAATCPAHYMVGLGLGEIDLYTSPVLDFTAHISDFPIMDGLCDSYRIPEFMTEGRIQKPEKALTNKDIGVPEDAFVIISSGRVVKFFSESYWRIISSVLALRPCAHLVVIGPTADDMSEWLKPYLYDSILSRVHFLGWRHDHAAVLAAADIMLDTFPQSGGYTLLEAMNLGIPTIFCRNRIEDFFDLFSEQKWMPVGEYFSVPGLSFDWDDTEGIQAALLQLIDQSERRQNLGQAARQALYGLGNAEQTAEALENLIRERATILALKFDMLAKVEKRSQKKGKGT